MLFTKVRVPFLCIDFAYTNSYVRSAIDETFLHTKNRNFLCQYTHGLSCRTTENVRKDSELVKLHRCFGFSITAEIVYGNVNACKM